MQLGSGYRNCEVFTSSTSWVCPADVFEAVIVVAGGGGGGAGGSHGFAPQPPGGAGSDGVGGAGGDGGTSTVAGLNVSLSQTGGQGGPSAFVSNHQPVSALCGRPSASGAAGGPYGMWRRGENGRPVPSSYVRTATGTIAGGTTTTNTEYADAISAGGDGGDAYGVPTLCRVVPGQTYTITVGAAGAAGVPGGAGGYGGHGGQGFVAIWHDHQP